MSEKQETVHVVMRGPDRWGDTQPVKVFDDRKDARAYAKRMSARSKRYDYIVKSVKKG